MKMEVQKGSKVKVHYTGTLEDGKVFDSSEGKDPLEFIAGVGMMIKGFDNAVIGMEEGEDKEIDVPSAEAYGEYREELIQEVPKEALKGDFDPKEGQQLMLKGPDGRQMIATIKKIGEEKMTLDLNHPLAGKDLHFKLKIEGISEMSAEEKEAIDKMMAAQQQQAHSCSGCGGDCGDECKPEEEPKEEEKEADAEEVMDALGGSEEEKKEE
jgi:peptidylprolyl isomerase